MSERLLVELPDELVERVARRAADLVLEELQGESESPWLSLSDAAVRARVSERTLQRMLAKGRVRSTSVGRRRLFHRDDLDALLLRAGDGGGVAPTAPPRRQKA